MIKRMMLLLIALTVFASSGHAQSRPDFSGTWKLSGTTPPNYPGSAGWGVPSPTLVVKQTSTEVTIQAGQYGPNPMSVVYKLDGSKVDVQAPEGITETGQAMLNGSNLVITSRRSFSSPAGDVVVDFNGNGVGAGDGFRFIGFGTAAQGATFTQLNATQWQIRSGLDAHNEVITLQNGASVDPSDYLFI